MREPPKQIYTDKNKQNSSGIYLLQPGASSIFRNYFQVPDSDILNASLPALCIQGHYLKQAKGSWVAQTPLLKQGTC